MHKGDGNLTYFDHHSHEFSIAIVGAVTLMRTQIVVTSA